MVSTSARAGQPLHLAVHGSVDSAALAAAVANELGVEVALVDGTCELPCLDVTVDGRNTAMVVFAPRSGSPRQRDLSLGSDTAQWPLVITLLAGNVVRDEASDVLAGLPSGLPQLPAGAPPPTPTTPPAPDDAETGPVTHPDEPGLSSPAARVAPATPEVPEEAAGEHRWLELGLVPVLSTDLLHVGSVEHYLSIDLLVGVSGGSTGLSLSGIADIERGPVAGLQVGGVATVAHRVAGTQVAGVGRSPVM